MVSYWDSNDTAGTDEDDDEEFVFSFESGVELLLLLLFKTCVFVTVFINRLWVVYAVQVWVLKSTITKLIT